MKKKPIAVLVSSILAAGLVGCNSATDTAATSSTPAATTPSAQSQTKSSANVTFSAAFPDAGDAQAAVIDENTTSILIQVYATEVSNWSDYFGQQNNYGDYYEGYGGYFEESLVSEFYLDAASPSQSVSLIPGPYRIVASQFNAAGLESSTPTSEAVTLGELVSGENSVILNMLHGTWTFEDEAGADAPLELQLLGRTDLVDADPNTEGQQTLDWDPSTPDTVESVADVLGLNGTTIKGLHLIGLPSGLFDGYDGYGGYDEFYGAQYAAVSSGETISRYGYYSLMRQDDGSGGEVTVAPSIPQYGELCDSVGDNCTTWEPGGLALVLHEFDGAEGTNTAQVDLGSVSISTDIYDSETEAWNNFGAGLFTVARYEMQSFIYGDITDNSDWPGEPTDDGTNIIYTPQADESSYQWQRGYNDELGNYQIMYLANLSVSGETFSHTNTESPLFGLANETVASDGTTIAGTIIEYVDVQTTQDPDRDGGYSGAGAPLYNGPAPASLAGQSNATKIAAIKRALILDEMAINAGLKAQAANVNGSNCRTLSIDESQVNAHYAWDAETAQWIAGEYNDTYAWDGEVVTGDDWNGNGIVERFEAGVIRNNSYWQEWDAVNLVYIDRGDDLDGDGTPEQIENVAARQRDSSSVVEACVHPFILKGSQLTYVADTTVDVASE